MRCNILFTYHLLYYNSQTMRHSLLYVHTLIAAGDAESVSEARAQSEVSIDTVTVYWLLRAQSEVSVGLCRWFYFGVLKSCYCHCVSCTCGDAVIAFTSM